MKYKRIAIDKLNVAVSYQRQVSRTMVSTIVTNYQADCFGTLTVGLREDGTYWVVDGQTRLEAARKLGLRNVPCMVFESEGQSHEAQLFRLVNNQRHMSLAAKVKAQLIEGDPDTHAVSEIVAGRGFELCFDKSGGWPRIRTFKPLFDLYEAGLLERALDVVRLTWSYGDGDGDDQALQLPVLGGLRLFMKRYGSIVSDEQLSKKLSKYTCAQLVAKCDARKMQGGSRASALCDVICDLFGKEKLDAKV